MSKKATHYQSISEVLQHYDLKVKTVRSTKNSNMWKVKGEDESYALKRSKSSREKLLLLHSIMDKVRSNFPHVLKWVKTKNGSPIIVVNGSAWYVTPWISRKEIEKVKSEEIIKGLATFHKCTQEAISSFPDLHMNFSETQLSSWRESGKDVLTYKVKRADHEFQSPFDKCFARNEDMIERVVDFSIRGLEKFFELEKGKPARFALCHKRLHPRNVVNDENNFYFVNFDHTQVESPILDIAEFLRGFSEAGRTDHPLNLLREYESVNPLLPMEKKLLALHLAYPSLLLEVVDQYYNQDRVKKNELSSLRRLEKEVNQLEQFEELIKLLWNTKKKAQKSATTVAQKANARVKVRT